MMMMMMIYKFTTFDCCLTGLFSVAYFIIPSYAGFLLINNGEILRISRTRFLQAGRHWYCQTNKVEAVKLENKF